MSNIGAAFPLIGDILNFAANEYTTDETNWMNQRIAKENRDWQSSENEKSRAWEREQWMLENQYNTPAAQMSRYREAGLNPFLAQSEIGAAGGSAGSPASVAAPSSIPAQRMDIPNFGSSFAQAAQLALQDKKVNADVANQQAQTMSEVVRAANMLLEDGQKDLAHAVLRQGFASVGKVDANVSLITDRMESSIAVQRSQAALHSEQAKLVKEYGAREAEERITKIKDEQMQIHAQVGLWASMARLNDSSVKVNEKTLDKMDAEIEELIARSYKEWSESSYVQSLKLTEDEKRDWYVNNLLIECARNGLLYGNELADYQELSGVRKFKGTKAAQLNATWNYSFGSSAPYVTADKILSLAGKATGFRVPYRPRSSSVYRSPWLDDE